MELVVLDGLSVRDAAEALGVSHVAARVRLHRARRLLQRQLGEATDLGQRMIMKEASA
jgi:DNA-directed RNA polymerase specialized sigma24 family protein